MNQSKSYIFLILFIAALAGTMSILYRKQTGDQPVPSDDSAVTDTQQQSSSEDVLGATKSASDYSLEYTKEKSKKHFALTPENIIWFTNYERVKAGREPLRQSVQLGASAKEKNADMLDYQYFNHSKTTTPQPVGFDTFIDAQDYQFIKIGENLAKGDFVTSAEVVTAWMNSTTHKRNILDPSYKEIGIAITSGSLQGRYVTLVTQHFGDPKSSCPPVSTSTKRAIDSLRTRVAELQDTINTEQKAIAATNEIMNPQYNALINDYNAVVSMYNNTIKTMGELVNDYNVQVKEFDRCIQKRK